MDIRTVRRLLAQGKVYIRFAGHAITEARKDGLTAEDLEDTIIEGEVIEDDGIRVLLLHFTSEDRLPCHVVLEYELGSREAIVVTAYVPDAKEWETNWKKRKRKRRR
jgi:hypothetical protein